MFGALCRAVAPFSVAALVAVCGLAASPLGAMAQDGPTKLHTKYGEQRAYFRDWLAACRPGGYCSVLAYNGAGPGAAGVDADHILRVASPAEDAAYEIMFTGVAAYVDETSTITVLIDGRKVADLPPYKEAGWTRNPRVLNDYFFSKSAAGGTLVEKMKAGGRIRLQFYDKKGNFQDIEFSLIGLTGALAWIETARME
ncbi:MAG: hypothetical protein MRY74_03460 [Neomegalonema sp.]|nr:hypothetical protein [Neomegalonema sp.]